MQPNLIKSAPRMLPSSPCLERKVTFLQLLICIMARLYPTISRIDQLLI